MRWIYLGLAIFAAVMTVVVTFFAKASDRPEFLRVSLTACVVNLALFLMLHRAGAAKNTKSRPWTIRW
jgi:multidrug transporter EmrE-like cation transporter